MQCVLLLLLIDGNIESFINDCRNQFFPFSRASGFGIFRIFCSNLCNFLSGYFFSY